MARFQTVWETNVCSGPSNEHLVGFYFYKGTLTRQVFLKFK